MNKILSSGLVIGAMISFVGCGGGSDDDDGGTEELKEVVIDGETIDVSQLTNNTDIWVVKNVNQDEIDRLTQYAKTSLDPGADIIVENLSCTQLGTYDQVGTSESLSDGLVEALTYFFQNSGRPDNNFYCKEYTLSPDAEKRGELSFGDLTVAIGGWNNDLDQSLHNSYFDTYSITPTVTGKFIDTYVSGLNYNCLPSLRTGTTNSMGEYTCNVEDSTIIFSLGDYQLGSSILLGIITPYDIQSDSSAALNVAQLLQTLDTDINDDIITIPENFTDLDNVSIALDDANFDSQMGAELGATLVSEKDAQNHLDEMLGRLLAGNTLYGENNYDEWRFDDALTKIYLKDVDSNIESGYVSISVEGNTITADGGTTTVEAEIEKFEGKWIDLTWTSGPDIGMTDKIWYDLAELEAYYESQGLL